MALAPDTVLVLGAGFTRAILPRAPLSKHDYSGDALERKFRGFPSASRLLRLERSRNDGDHIDLERLMTRLDGGTPYDAHFGGQAELALLLSELKWVFLSKLDQAKDAESFPDEMSAAERWFS